MAKGKKTSPDVIYQVMTLWFTNYNMRETARILNMPVSTVKDIVDKNKNSEEFEFLRTQKQKEFADKASEIIEKAFVLLNRRLDRAIADEEELDDLIDEVYFTDNDEMSYPEKSAIIAKIKGLQLQSVKELTTAMGTMFDKRALSRGESTQNIDFATNFDVSKLIEIAGYTKKDDD